LREEDMSGNGVLKLFLVLMLANVVASVVSVRPAKSMFFGDADLVPTLRLLPENVTVRKGDVFSVSVVLDNIPLDPGMAGIQFAINWNQTVLNALNMTEVLFHDVTPVSEWDNIWEIRNVVNNTEGSIFYAYTWQDGTKAREGGYSPISGNHTLATVTFEAVEAGSTVLHFSDLVAGDPDGLLLISMPDDPRTPILSSLIIDGAVRVPAASTGDVNEDGVVDLFDALLFAQHFGSKQGDLNWDSFFDLNHDGEVDVFDVIALARAF
jgi:hypothetical protein